MSADTLTDALQELRDLDGRLHHDGWLIDACIENLSDAGDPEPPLNEPEHRVQWIRRLIASVESEAESLGLLVDSS